MAEIIRMGPLEIRFLESRESTDGSVDVFEMFVPPNANMPVPHYHESWDEVVYGLTGVISYMVDGVSLPLKQGDCIFVRRGIVHGFRNDTQEMATCLVVLTPGVLGPQYFRDVAELTKDGPPDLVKMRELMARNGLVPVAG